MPANVEIILTGFGVVMGALTILWAMTSLIGQVAIRIDRRTPAPVTVPASPEPATKDSGIPAHHLVAIAAAVDAVLDRPHRIVAVEAPPHRVTGWARIDGFGGFDRKMGKR